MPPVICLPFNVTLGDSVSKKNLLSLVSFAATRFSFSTSFAMPKEQLVILLYLLPWPDFPADPMVLKAIFQTVAANNPVPPLLSEDGISLYARLGVQAIFTFPEDDLFCFDGFSLSDAELLASFSFSATHPIRLRQLAKAKNMNVTGDPCISRPVHPCSSFDHPIDHCPAFETCPNITPSTRPSPRSDYSPHLVPVSYMYEYLPVMKDPPLNVDVSPFTTYLWPNFLNSYSSVYQFIPFSSPFWLSLDFADPLLPLLYLLLLCCFLAFLYSFPSLLILFAPFSVFFGMG